MRRRVAAYLVLCGLCALACGSVPEASADREAAEFFSKRGEKALKERNWPAAEEAFRRALGEDAGHLPALAGLAESLLGAGDATGGLAELRRAVEAADALKPPVPAGWAEVGARARKRLAEVDASGAALAKIQAKYADDLVLLATKWQRLDPGLAERALRRAARVQPGHPKATELLRKMGIDATADVTDLWNGADFEGWDGASAKWSVVDGTIVANVVEHAYEMHTLRTLEGNFDVRMEARFLEVKEGSMFGLSACFRGSDTHWRLGVFAEKVILREYEAANRDGRTVLDVLARNVKPPLDPRVWNRYELRFRTDEIVALVNGQVIGRDRRPKDETGGAVSLTMQSGRAAFRRIEAVPR